MMCDELLKYNKSGEIVKGLVEALHKKSSHYGVGGAAIVLGFQTDQIDYIDVDISDVIPVNEHDGTDVSKAQAVIDYCKCCLKEIADGADHFEPIDYDGYGTETGCAVLRIEDITFMVAVATDTGEYGVNCLLRLGDLYCPYRAWYGVYDCTICTYYD